MAVLNERFMINKKRSCLILFANAIKQMMRKYLVKWHYTSEKSGKPTETTETEYLTETIVA